MAYLVDTNNYSDDELGLALYRALSITIEGAEPYYMLADDDKAYYMAAARDFIRYLQRHEGQIRGTLKRRLWIFDYTDMKAKCLWLHNEKRSEPETWMLRQGKTKYKYYLGKTAFLHKDEALRYGWDELNGYLDASKNALERLSREIQEDAATRDAEPVDEGED